MKKGNLLGEGEWKRARIVGFLGGYISILMGLFIAISIWLLRHQLILIWSNGMIFKKIQKQKKIQKKRTHFQFMFLLCLLFFEFLQIALNSN